MCLKKTPHKAFSNNRCERRSPLPLDFTDVSQRQKRRQVWKEVVFACIKGIWIPVPAGPQRHEGHTFLTKLKTSSGKETIQFGNIALNHLLIPKDKFRDVKMSKLLFSKIHFYDIKDLFPNIKQPRR